MYWRFCLKSRFVIKIATTDQQLWGKLNQRVVGKADRAQPCTRSHFILGSNLLSISRNKLTYFHCLLSTSSATIKLCGFPPPLINRTKNFPLHFQLVSLLPPKVLLEDWWLMMAMLKKKRNLLKKFKPLMMTDEDLPTIQSNPHLQLYNAQKGTKWL